MRIVALIPAYNELEALPRTVSELQGLAPDLSVLVVDDASTDGTGEVLPHLGVGWLQLAQHLGLGGAIRAGLRYSRILGFEAVVRLDADGQHPPTEIGALLAALSDGDTEAVIGSRFRSPSGYRASPARRTGHRILATCLSAVTGQRFTDPTSGFWAFGPRALTLLSHHYPRGYSEPELILFLWRNGLRVEEVPVTMRYREHGRSTLTLPRGFLALARNLLALGIVPFRSGIEERDPRV